MLTSENIAGNRVASIYVILFGLCIANQGNLCLNEVSLGYGYM